MVSTAPPWRFVIISGLGGGIANWTIENFVQWVPAAASDVIGVVVFILLLMAFGLLKKHPVESKPDNSGY